MAAIEKRLHKTCDQMTILHSTIKNLQVRYKRATKHTQSLSAYNLKLQLQTLQSVYNMYYMYASKQAQQLIVCSTQDN